MGPLLPLLGVVAEFIMANGARAAAMRYGPKAVEQGLKQIKTRQNAINQRVGKMKEKGEIPLREKTPLQQQKSLETRLANERAKRMRGEAPRSRFDEEGFPIDEVPLQFAEGDVVNSGLGSLMGESGRTMSNMDMMMADQAARQGISPAEQRMMMIQKTATDMGRTISDRDAQLFGMGEISFEEAMSRATSDMDMQQEDTPFVGTLPINQIPGLEMLGMPRKEMAEGDEVSKFPDLTGDGKVTQADILKGRGVFQEGGAVEGEIDKGLEELQGVAPEAMVIQQVMTMVMEMMQSGASEEQIVAALKEMGLDEEDIQQVMMMVAEQMQGQDSIDGQLAQMM
jgi:SOS response regulatory protein OraA/RecX